MSDQIGGDPPEPSQRPIQIVRSVDGHKFFLDEESLERLFFQEEIRDRHVMVVSVAGAFRKGKSFILDFFLRYLRCEYGGEERFAGDWLGAPNKPLEGFSWRGGAERETTGILIWSEVFIAQTSEGEVAIVLMDTQGAFDSESTVRDSATIFALSTMISSVLVFNLSQNIQEDDLQHLQLFTEYGRMAFEHSGQKPFQKLMFLVRDWSYPYDAEFGEIGGKRILDRRLSTAGKHPDLKALREHITSCFSDISCFLMPHPGLVVATNQSFNGRVSDIEPEFKNYLKKLAPSIFSRDKLIIKDIGGNKVRVKDLLFYFKSYMSIFTGDELPEPKTILAATAEANHLSAVAAAKDAYSMMMQGLCGGGKPYINTSILQEEHARIKELVLKQFSSKKKMGGDELSETYMNKLTEELDMLFEQLRAQNESKNLLSFTRTPIVFAILATSMYIFSGFFGLIGLYYCANICNILFAVLIIALATWIYTHFTGDHAGISESLDAIALYMNEHLIKPLIQSVVDSANEHNLYDKIRAIRENYT